MHNLSACNSSWLEKLGLCCCLHGIIPAFSLVIVFRVIATVQRTIFYCLSSKVVLGSQSSLFSVGKFDSDLKEQCSQTIVFYRTFCRTFCTTFCRTLCRTYNSLSFASSTDMKFIECELPCVVNPIRDKAGQWT